MFHFDFTATDAADHMMMIIFCDLISDVTAPGLRGTNQSVFGEEIQCTIYSRFGKTWQFAPRLLIDFTWRKMRPCVMEDMQNRHSLRRHSKSAGAELGSIIRGTGHNLTLIARTCNNPLYSTPNPIFSYIKKASRISAGNRFSSG